MTISKSNVAPLVIKQLQFEIGTFYLFNHIAVIEFNEGVHVDIEAFKKPMNDLIAYFGSTTPFGLVANRVNSYSISILDLPKIGPNMPNLVAYGVVTHNKAGKMSAALETNFCEADNICFDNLYEGLDTVYSRVKKKMLIALN